MESKENEIIKSYDDVVGHGYICAIMTSDWTTPGYVHPVPSIKDSSVFLPVLDQATPFHGNYPIPLLRARKKTHSTARSETSSGCSQMWLD